MKIKIDHINNTYNYGSLMMAINTIRVINDYCKDAEFYVDTDTNEDLERLIKETNVDKIYKQKKYKEINYNNNVSKLYKIYRKLKKPQLDGKYYDCNIVLGGDDISEYYGSKFLINGLIKIKLSTINMPVMLIGQTIGPFTSYRKNLVKHVLKKTKIYTRDDNCTEYLKNMNMKNIMDGRDLAFLELPNNKKSSGILEKYELTDKKYITIVPSGLYMSYIKNKETYINEQIKIIENIMNCNELDEFNIVLLPHVLKPEFVDDTIMIKEIMNKVNPSYKNRIIAIEDSMLASEAREILGNGSFTISGRMHASVSTFYMRKPSISLSYSVKYAGVIGNGLDMSDLVIESKAEDWTSGKISNIVMDKIKYVINNYDDLIKKIDKNVKNVSDIVNNELVSISNLINESSRG